MFKVLQVVRSAEIILAGGHFSIFPKSDGAARRLKFFWLLGVAALGVVRVWGGSEAAVFRKGATCRPVAENEGACSALSFVFPTAPGARLANSTCGFCCVKDGRKRW